MRSVTMQAQQEVIRFAADSVHALLAYVGTDLRYVFANRAYETWFGSPTTEVEGLHMSQVLGEEAFQIMLPYAKRALAGESVVFEALVNYKTSGSKCIRTNYVPDIQRGHVAGFSVFVEDISELRRDQQTQAFLAEASAELSASLDYQATLARVAHLAVRSLADWCVVSMHEAVGKSRRIALAHRDPDRVKWAEELETRYPPDPDATSGELQVLRSGKPELYSTISPDLLAKAAKDEEHLKIMQEARIGSAIIVPISAGPEVLGAITLVSGEPGRYGEDELHIAEELAARASLAIQNARLYQQAEHQLEERINVSRRLRTLIDQSPLSIQAFAPDGRCTMANAAWEQLWGASAESLGDYNILQDEQFAANGIMPDIKAAFEGEVRRTPTFLYNPTQAGKTGRPRWIHCILYPVYSEVQRIQEVVLILQDVTGEKEAQHELQIAQEQFRLIVNSALDAVITIDRHSNILFWDGRSEEIFGWTRAEALGKKIYELVIPPEFREQHIRGVEHLVATGEGSILNRTVQLEALRKDGLRFPVEIAIAEIKGRGGTTFSAFVRDITLRKEAENALKESQAQYQALATELEHRVSQRTRELEQANRELEAFSYSVSHDLRAPLRTISSYSQLLLLEQLEKLDEDGRDNLERIVDAAKRMSKLIDDLLQYARLSRTELRIEEVNLTDLVGTVVKDMHTKYPDQKTQTVIAPGMVANGDVGLLRVALENLIENAYKFSSKVTDPRVEVGFEDKGGERIYFVRDNGAGFDMKYASKLFKPFERLHGDSDFPGTGIGLTNVQRVVQRHHGRIWAAGEVGVGATFYFTLNLESSPS